MSYYVCLTTCTHTWTEAPSQGAHSGPGRWWGTRKVAASSAGTVRPPSQAPPVSISLTLAMPQSPALVLLPPEWDLQPSSLLLRAHLGCLLPPAPASLLLHPGSVLSGPEPFWHQGSFCASLAGGGHAQSPGLYKDATVPTLAAVVRIHRTTYRNSCTW